MTTLQFVSKLIVQRRRYGQRTREPDLQNVRASSGIAPLFLEFLQSWLFTRIPGSVPCHVGVLELAILVFGGAKVRPKFRPALIERDRVPEVSYTAVGDGERETMWDQADGIDCVPVLERSMSGKVS